MLIVVTMLLSGCSESKPPPEAVTSGLVVKLSLEELVANADQIVMGTIIAKESRQNAESNSICTLATLSTKQWLKGKSPDKEIAISVPGEETNGISEWVEDVASFEPGESVLVFLQINRDGTSGVVGGCQGKFIVTNGNVVQDQLSSNELLLTKLISQIETEVDKTSE